MPLIPKGFVEITHKDLGDSVVHEKAFEDVWSEKGWKLKNGAKKAAPPPPAPEPEPAPESEPDLGL